ncbi:MAG: STAS domain-containing protein [Zhengella sp.]|uniref:STAS domain-containing protein n=1 Tax=Zhengella sp. TaxID=2282762 RepID=UPI001D9F57AE|nr:STAS domain-containing protein [Notoacmeibacter sp.]MCC0028653.1 STAS domain-containing protein [Brucellaceae bacterium]
MTKTITMSGDLDAARITVLRPEIDAIAAGDSDVTIDMSQCRFIDSSGVGAIVFLHKRMRSRGYRVRLSNLHGQPLKLLRHLGIAGLLSADDRSAA